MKDPIALQKAVAVYTEIGKRQVSVPVDADLQGRTRRPSDGPVFETYRDGSTRSQKPRRCCARRGRAAEDPVVLGGRNWLRKAAMLLALCAGGVSCICAAAGRQRRRGRRIPTTSSCSTSTFASSAGDGVRAYNTPEGTVSS